MREGPKAERIQRELRRKTAQKATICRRIAMLAIIKVAAPLRRGTLAAGSIFIFISCHVSACHRMAERQCARTES